MGRVVDVDGEVRREVDGEAGVDTGGGVWGLQPPFCRRSFFLHAFLGGFWRLQPPLLSKNTFFPHAVVREQHTPPPSPAR